MRRRGWLVTAGTMIGIVGAGMATAGAPDGAPPPMIGPSAESPGLWCFQTSRRAGEAAYERALMDAVDPASLRAFHDHLAAEPHPAGSEGDLRVIEYLRSQFDQMGLEVEVQWIDVYLAEPVVGEVEIVRRDGADVREALPVKERAVDEFSADPRVSIGWNAYSGSGDVEGEVVYANYGTKEDFETLAAMGVDCTGKIVVARYGRNFRGYKAKFAEKAGAAGLIIYNDPEDVGYVRGLMYPEGGWANETQIQRGGIATLPYAGDPLTPGQPAIEGTTRLDPEDVALPRIPVQPVGWVAAEPILAAMRGDVVPEAWQGGLDLNYRVEGGEGLRVRVHVEQERKLVRTANVVGTLRSQGDMSGKSIEYYESISRSIRELEEHLKAHPGDGPTANLLELQRARQRHVERHPVGRYANPLVVVGCHHDAWTHGAGDPTCGLMVVMEMARTFAELATKGQRPSSTICFAAWGAEEYAIIGSTEWVEQHAEDLFDNCIAYVNLDMAAMGPNFGASASPLLKSLIADATRDVEQPGQPGTSVHDAWVGRSDGRTPEQQIGSLGGGSDHVGFYCRLGIPSMGMGAGGSNGVSYHSAYDNLAWYRAVVGEDYAPAAMITRVADVAVARLANADILPMDVAGFAEQISSDLDALEARAATLDRSVPSVEDLHDAINSLRSAGDTLRPSLDRMLANSDFEPTSRENIYWQLFWLNRAWTTECGLPERPWFRSVLVATDPNTGYGSWAFPALRWYVESGADPDGAYESSVRAYTSTARDLTKRIQIITGDVGVTPAQVDRP